MKKKKEIKIRVSWGAGKYCPKVMKDKTKYNRKLKHKDSQFSESPYVFVYIKRIHFLPYKRNHF